MASTYTFWSSHSDLSSSYYHALLPALVHSLHGHGTGRLSSPVPCREKNLQHLGAMPPCKGLFTQGPTQLPTPSLPRSGFTRGAMVKDESTCPAERCNAQTGVPAVLKSGVIRSPCTRCATTTEQLRRLMRTLPPIPPLAWRRRARRYAPPLLLAPVLPCSMRHRVPRCASARSALGAAGRSLREPLGGAVWEPLGADADSCRRLRGLRGL